MTTTISRIPRRQIFTPEQREAVFGLLQDHRDELLATHSCASRCDHVCFDCEEFAQYFSKAEMEEVRRMWGSLNRAEDQGYANDEHVVYYFDKYRRA